MMKEYDYLVNLAESTAVPEKGILSQSIVNNEYVRVVAFGFAAGEELTEHTASVPAIIQIVSGSAEVGLGKERYQAGQGFWAFMPPNLPHSILAKTPVQMILIMLKKQA